MYFLCVLRVSAVKISKTHLWLQPNLSSDLNMRAKATRLYFTFRQIKFIKFCLNKQFQKDSIYLFNSVQNMANVVYNSVHDQTDSISVFLPLHGKKGWRESCCCCCTTCGQKICMNSHAICSLIQNWRQFLSLTCKHF